MTVLGGNFALPAGGNNFARWNKATEQWVSIGSGMDSTVRAFTTANSGSLVAAGSFTTCDGLACSRIAMCDGTTWSALGAGLNGSVYALVTLANGDIIAGGSFGNSGGVPMKKVALWDGTAWSALGSGMNATVNALAVMPNGDLIAGGAFTMAGGIPANHIARWDGTAWHALDQGVDAEVNDLAIGDDGSLLIAGAFSTASGLASPHVARWNGTSWHAMPGFPAEARAVSAFQGSPIAGTAAGDVLKWSGSQWQVTGTLAASVNCLEQLDDGRIVAGHEHATANNQVHTWDGGVWHLYDDGNLDGFVDSMARMPDGTILATGWFTNAGGGVAQWNGHCWLQFSPLSMSGLHMTAKGQLLGRLGSGLYAWDGSTWQGQGVWGVRFISSSLEGDPIVVAGNGTTIYTLQGGSWVQQGTSLAISGSSRINCAALLANGDILAGGFWLNTPAGPATVARWNGAGWSRIAGNGYEVDAMAPLNDGRIAIAPVDPWESAVYSPATNSLTEMVGVYYFVSNLYAIPNGECLVSGSFPGRLVRWNGTSANFFAGQITGQIGGLAFMPDGNVMTATGYHSNSINPPMTRVLRSNCPATVTAVPSGCDASHAASQLGTIDNPWIGDKFRTLGTDLPTQAFTLNVLGTTNANLPLGNVLPTAVPGCTLLVDPLSVELVTPTGGKVLTDLVIPNDPLLIGSAFSQQLVFVEHDPQLNITNVSSTNSLRMVINRF